jgi:glycogen synthase kinase 3 beta
MIRTFSKNKEVFPLFLIKLYAFQIARAMAHMHSSGVLHRDIKPQNVLIDNSTNKVFICDFGSAKKCNGDEQNVAYICSRYYRAPELIFGNMDYDSSIDIWSFGCVLAEMLLGKPLFQGDSTVDQLLQIIKILGVPDNDQLQFLNKNNTLKYEFPLVRPTTIVKVFSNFPKEVASLLQKIFVYEAVKRPTAYEIMAHSFFDDLRNSDLSQNGRFIFPQIFDFTESELIACNKKEVLKKILPEWSEGYRTLKD